jgi:hypothetical protein
MANHGSSVEPANIERYQLTDEDRLKAVSPEARARRRATLKQRRAERAEAVVWLRRERQMVPEAIADYLGLSDGQVRAYLRELNAWGGLVGSLRLTKEQVLPHLATVLLSLTLLCVSLHLALLFRSGRMVAMGVVTRPVFVTESSGNRSHGRVKNFSTGCGLSRHTSWHTNCADSVTCPAIGPSWGEGRRLPPQEDREAHQLFVDLLIRGAEIRNEAKRARESARETRERSKELAQSVAEAEGSRQLTPDRGYAKVLPGNKPEALRQMTVQAHNQEPHRDPSEVCAANDRIADKAEALRFVSRVPMLCECSALDCRAIVMIGLEEFRQLRRCSDNLLITPGH